MKFHEISFHIEISLIRSCDVTVVCSHSHMTHRRVSETPVTSHHRGAVAGQEPEHQDGVGHDGMTSTLNGMTKWHGPGQPQYDAAAQVLSSEVTQL